MMNRYVLVLWCLLILCGTGFAVEPHRDQARYEFPRSIEIQLSASGSSTTAQPCAIGTRIPKEIIATIRSTAGDLQQLEFLFDTSPDLQLTCATTAQSLLPEGQAFTLTCPLTLAAGQPDELGSWVRLAVRYRPDYERLHRLVTNAASYPVDLERRRLIDIVKTNRKTHERATDGARLFLTRQ